MKLNLRIIILIFSSSIMSCKQKQNEKIINNTPNNWEEIEVNTRTEKLKISKFSDSAEYENNPNNITFKILPEDGKIIEEKIIRKKIYFSKSEKDSLAKYVYESVTNPKFTDVFATELAGSVIFIYDTGKTKLICENESVGDWSILSESTKKIYELISKKVEISKN